MRVSKVSYCRFTLTHCLWITLNIVRDNVRNRGLSWGEVVVRFHFDYKHVLFWHHHLQYNMYVLYFMPPREWSSRNSFTEFEINKKVILIYIE